MSRMSGFAERTPADDAAGGTDSTIGPSNMTTSSRILGLASCLLPTCLGLAQLTVDFTGAFSPGNWTIVNQSGSSAIFTDSTQLELVGPDSGGGENLSTISITIPQSGTLSFAYAVSTTDAWRYDAARYSVNGTPTLLTPDPDAIEPTGNSPVNGNVSNLALTAGQTFAFEAWSRDSFAGAVTLQITSFSFNAVPEPQAYAWCAALGLAGLATIRRCRKSS